MPIFVFNVVEFRFCVLAHSDSESLVFYLLELAFLFSLALRVYIGCVGTLVIHTFRPDRQVPGSYDIS
jgi:hypothetical protein